MAREITVRAELSVLNGYLNESQKLSEFVATQTTLGATSGSQTIGTSEEVIDYGDVAAPRWAYFRNTDTVNYIEIGPTSGGAMVVAIKLLAGEQCVFPIGGSVVLRAKANTAACKLKKLILET